MHLLTPPISCVNLWLRNKFEMYNISDFLRIEWLQNMSVFIKVIACDALKWSGLSCWKHVFVWDQGSKWWEESEESNGSIPRCLQEKTEGSWVLNTECLLDWLISTFYVEIGVGNHEKSQVERNYKLCYSIQNIPLSRYNDFGKERKGEKINNNLISLVMILVFAFKKWTYIDLLY